MKVDARQSPDHQGFIRTGGVDPDANPDLATDIKERFFMSRELLPEEPARGRFKSGQSRWPAPDVAPGFEAAMKAYIVRLLALTTALGRAFAVSLGLPEDYFDPHYRHPGAVLAFNYYPPLDRATIEVDAVEPLAAYRLRLVYLRIPGRWGGVQVSNAAGEWINVAPRPGTYVVNLGDLFQRWTNDLYISTCIASSISGTARVSATLFVRRPARRCKLPPTCHGPDNPPRYPPVDSAEFNARWSTSSTAPAAPASRSRRHSASRAALNRICIFSFLFAERALYSRHGRGGWVTHGISGQGQRSAC